MDTELKDALTLLALTAVDANKLTKDLCTFEKDIAEYRRYNKETIEIRKLPEIDRKNRYASAAFSMAVDSSYKLEVDVSSFSDEQVAKIIFTPGAYADYIRCNTIVKLIEKLTHPTQSLTSEQKSDTTVIDREKVARDALEALTPTERTIQMHRYCRDCGKELTNREHFCGSIKF